MAELVKPWNDEGSLTVAYEGDGDGSAVFSSSTNEGIDREMSVSFVDQSRSIVVDRRVSQVGLREVFLPSDGDFILADGGTFNVLKGKPYTELEYLESSGTQYLNLGIVFKNTDECYAEVAMLTNVSDKFFVSPSKWNNNANRFALGGCYNKVFGTGYGGVTTGNTRFSPTVNIDYEKHIFTYKDYVFAMEDKGATKNVSSISWGGDTTELYLFYGYNKATACRVYCYQQKRDGKLIIDLIPVLDKDNVACMYDKVSGSYFYNQGSGTFVAGYKNE